MSKGSEILGRIVGAGSMLASVAFFGNMGSVHEYVLPGLLFGASGLWMVVRRGERRAPTAELDVQQRLAQLAQGLSATQQELASTQEQLERMSEERDFLRQLATPAGPRPSAEPQPRPVEVRAPPRAPEIGPPG